MHAKLSLWSAKGFGGLGRCLTGEEAFSQGLCRAPAHIITFALCRLSSYADKNGPPGKTSLEMLPLVLVKPMGLQGDKTSG